MIVAIRFSHRLQYAAASETQSSNLCSICSDAAGLVRTLFKTVEYIHGCGIVHRGMYDPRVFCLRVSFAIRNSLLHT